MSYSECVTADTVDECVPEIIDGREEGCGFCEPCRRQESDRVESMVSGGFIAEDEADSRLERIWR